MTLTLTLPPTFLKIFLLGLMSVGPKPVGRQKNLWGQNLWGQKKPCGAKTDSKMYVPLVEFGKSMWG